METGRHDILKNDIGHNDVHQNDTRRNMKWIVKAKKFIQL